MIGTLIVKRLKLDQWIPWLNYLPAFNGACINIWLLICSKIHFFMYCLYIIIYFKNICISELYAWIIHFYACLFYACFIMYVCQKFMYARNICIFRNKYACQKSMLVFQKNTLVRNILNGCHELFMYFKKYKHARNILMHVRNVCLYFQKT